MSAMSTRIIRCRVAQEYVVGAGAVLGATGGDGGTVLELEFEPEWAGCVKRLAWYDALGNFKTTQICTVDRLLPGSYNVYQMPVPLEALEVCGEALLTIRGAVVNEDGTLGPVRISATARFRVLEGRWPEALEKVSPSETEQLQAQIDAFLPQITTVTGNAELAWESSQQAQEAAKRADEDAQSARSSADRGADSARAAADSEAQARRYAGLAQAEAERAAVPAVAGIYNLILTDRVTGARFALLCEEARLVLLEVSPDLDAMELYLVDHATGVDYSVVVEDGRLMLEER